MRVLCFVLSFLLMASSSFCQGYIEVYRYGLMGTMQLEQEKPDSAEQYLVKALELMPDKSRFDWYFVLIKVADGHKDTKKISSYLRELSCIYPKDTIYSRVKTEAEISMDRATFEKLYHAKCTLSEQKKNHYPYAVDSIITSIRERDQGIRTKAHSITDLSKVDTAALKKEWADIDSVNFGTLLGCLKKYGLPRLNFPSSFSIATIIMHTDNYEHFKKIDSYLIKAMKEGHLCPTTYAYAMDRSLVASGLSPRYYWFIPGTDFAEAYKPEPKDLLKVNNERKAMGLPAYPVWTGWAF